MGAEDYAEIAQSETLAAAGWPDPFEDEAAHEARMEREQAWYASPEGVAWQFEQARAAGYLTPNPGDA